MKLLKIAFMALIISSLGIAFAGDGEHDDSENCTCEQTVEGCSGDCCSCDAEECDEACTCESDGCEHSEEVVKPAEESPHSGCGGCGGH